jgi:predicted small integral membrane protein
MIEFFFQTFFLMLAGILIWELLQFIIEKLKSLKIRRECEKWEDKAFEREMRKALEKLGIEYKRRHRDEDS